MLSKRTISAMQTTNLERLVLQRTLKDHFVREEIVMYGRDPETINTRSFDRKIKELKKEYSRLDALYNRPWYKRLFM